MRKVALLLGALGLLVQHSAQAGGVPRGSVLELHSCELYAGGCVVSSEATQGGRYMLRAWTFTDGDYAGVSLAGLSFAVLQISGDNLAAADSVSAQTMVYLPETATVGQRAALLGWLKSNQPDLAPAKTQTRIVPLSFSKMADGYQLSAGNFISVKTAGIESCPTGACGEALWYSPRSANSLFTVAVNRASSVIEPSFKLKWLDGGKKSVFLCKFGDETPSKNLYVTLADLCGPAGKLF